MKSAVMVGIDIICTMLLSAHLGSSSLSSGSFRANHANGQNYQGNQVQKVWLKFS
jgi:hypothetical protein